MNDTTILMAEEARMTDGKNKMLVAYHETGHAVCTLSLWSGVDPKSILCEFFKAGQCAKGFKCKFSHDLNVQTKGEKFDIFSDKRDEGTMEDWDLETLEKVVESKGKEYNQNKPTDIVCKHFLDAVEKKQYGWFWVCPNGNKECHYRHDLPPGYILKSQMKALLEEEANKLAIKDEFEDQVKAVCGRLRSNSGSYMLAEEKTLYHLLKNYEQIGSY
ncbi:zinc finger CCCH domain-containing protein 11-like isoform X1 [Helianthus annuus]|uniref:zinc finger CCCH domain-containing protein 11-like isoform X1 n=1 Tax=Helianthus annuus TaxID=4232 RepID=UPI0016532E4E|nr:zinc finger CCCH domain-containing protein 11-like isoform X1 [Helianthus annuus]XP_035836759.1 zinc finger CCCH domain-containing protein 11-like isoform X1 [Helianthus annuus]XP_035836760.1 zinc finger CCCH domain-containing protein 11-like isoform X1 [Helianthus annuus]XP_035836761.1 zinc finger CCCH domain-containing protein 11-like isoform X1 [Helianthus annuus]XP_035836762.1 zinc finger CCCH domain-containing protein 11-like isoform X1 [Helianthus annuus]XP_035836763.1 zinc finger CCC